VVEWLIFAIFLYIACAALIVAEVFVPSYGLLGTVALVCLAGGIAIFFHYSALAGCVGLVVAVVMVPMLLAFAYKVFPRTRFGRQATLAPVIREPGEAIDDRDTLAELLGQVGRVVTPLRPVGTCDFDGTRMECVSESGYVSKGQMVRVIHIDGTQLTVRVVDNT
jgi:membrane-bound serine protease (ClpP class)